MPGENLIRVGRSWFWALVGGLVSLIIIVLVIIFVFPCRFCPDPMPFVPTLTLTHEEIVALTPISNSFSTLVDGEAADGTMTDPSNLSNYWFGTLIQLGQYGRNVFQPHFTRADFYADGEVVGSLRSGEFVWLNIVAERSGALADPMATDEVLWLLPRYLTQKHGCPPPAGALGICEELWQTVTTANGTTLGIDPLCLRERTIHHDMRVSNLVTLWQGDGGHTWHVDPSVEDAGEHRPKRRSRFLVHIPDPFTVKAYMWSGPDQCSLVEVALPEKIERIVFEHGFGDDVEPGIRQDPPWP